MEKKSAIFFSYFYSFKFSVIAESIVILILTKRYLDNMSRVMRKLDLCLCESKDTDQLRSNTGQLRRTSCSFRHLFCYFKPHLGKLSLHNDNKSAAGMHDTPPRKFNFLNDILGNCVSKLRV